MKIREPQTLRTELFWLQLLLLGLKLADIGLVAHWSWWLVFAPLWAPFAAAFAVGIAWGLIELWRKRRDG